MVAGSQSRAPGAARWEFTIPVRDRGGRFGLAHVAVVVAGSSVVLGWMVASGHAWAATVLAALLLATPFLLRRPENGLLVGAALVLLVPSTVAFGPGHAGAVRVAVLVSLTGLLVFSVRGDLWTPSFAAPDLFIAGFVAAALISWALRPHTHNAVQATVAAVLPAFFYLAGRWFGGIAWTRLSVVVLLAATAGSVTVLFEFFIVHRPLFADQNSYFWNATGNAIFRPGGVFIGPPAAATTLAMAIPVGASLLSSTRGAAKRAIWACLAISAAALCATFTRAGVIAVAGALVLYLVLLRPPRIGRLIYAAIVVATLFGLFVLPKVARSSWYQEGVLRPGSLSVRESYWSAAWPVIVNSPQHLLVGHGINSLVRDPTARDRFVDPQVDIAAVPTLSTLSPHSQYVRTLVEEGVVGLLLLLGWLGAALVSVTRATRGVSSLRRAPLAACAAAIAAFLIAGYAADALREGPCFAMVALISGAGVSIASRRVEVQ